jgi:hypothetical protein
MKNHLLTIVQRALNGADALPPRERADLYESAAACLNDHAPLESLAALSASKALREAEHLQLELLFILKNNTAV